MFHEPYVELIDNNGNNQDEVEERRRAERRPRHMVLFYLRSRCLFPPAKHKRSTWLPAFFIFFHRRKNNYSTSGLPSPVQDIYARLSFLSFTIETTFIAGMLGRCYVVCSTLKSGTRKETNCYKFNASGWIGSCNEDGQWKCGGTPPVSHSGPASFRGAFEGQLCHNAARSCPNSKSPLDAAHKCSLPFPVFGGCTAMILRVLTYPKMLCTPEK